MRWLHSHDFAQQAPSFLMQIHFSVAIIFLPVLYVRKLNCIQFTENIIGRLKWWFAIKNASSRKKFPFFPTDCSQLLEDCSLRHEKLHRRLSRFLNCGALSSGTILKALSAAGFNQSSSDYKVALWDIISMLCWGNPEAFNSLWKECFVILSRNPEICSDIFQLS